MHPSGLCLLYFKGSMISPGSGSTGGSSSMRDAGVRFAAYAFTVSDTPATALRSSAVNIRSKENTAWENAMPDAFVAFFRFMFVTNWFFFRRGQCWNYKYFVMDLSDPVGRESVMGNSSPSRRI